MTTNTPALAREYRIIGPPGTGKTTYLARQVERAVESFGEDAVLVASMTRTAAHEIAGRLDLPEGVVGTLHSHAYRALDRPDIAESHVKDWNVAHPALALKKIWAEHDDADGIAEIPDQDHAEAGGEEWYQTMNLFRARMIPLRLWPTRAIAFHTTWTAWKDAHGYLDFTDLIEHALESVLEAPGRPAAIFLDEAQDLSALEMALARQWASSCERLLVVGDPDQALFAWRGGDPSVFTTPELPDAQYRVLSQSYRVPRSVHALAASIIAPHAGRRPVVYTPRQADGEVFGLDQSETISAEARAEALADQIEIVLQQQNRTIMILATCGYMLVPVLKELRERGIPFSNRWRRKRGDWNPLKWGSAKRMTGYDRVRAFLATSRQFFGEDASDYGWPRRQGKAWLEMLRATGDSALFRRGGKTALDKFTGDTITISDLERWLWDGQDSTMPQFEAILDHIFSDDLDWLWSSALPRWQHSIGYPIAAVKAYGREETEAPRVTIGTVHSVKGGEADVVFLLPDVSPSAMKAMMAQRGLDDLRRVAYVGVTRAREQLVICPSIHKTGQTLQMFW